MKKKVNRDEKKLLTGKKLVSFFSLGGLGEKKLFSFLLPSSKLLFLIFVFFVFFKI